MRYQRLVGSNLHLTAPVTIPVRLNGKPFHTSTAIPLHDWYCVLSACCKNWRWKPIRKPPREKEKVARATKVDTDRAYYHCSSDRNRESQTAPYSTTKLTLHGVNLPRTIVAPNEHAPDAQYACLRVFRDTRAPLKTGIWITKWKWCKLLNRDRRQPHGR